jgi:hypothetical protein
LPTGLSLNATSGLISGTPTGHPGVSTFTVRVHNGILPDDTKSFDLEITPAATIPTKALPHGIMNQSYFQIVSVGYTVAPLLVLSGSLPLGVITPVGFRGVLSGFPVAAGTYSFSVNVTDDAGNPTQSLSITIDPAATIPAATSLLRSVLR